MSGKYYETIMRFSQTGAGGNPTSQECMLADIIQRLERVEKTSQRLLGDKDVTSTQDQANAWLAVWEALKEGNPGFYRGPNTSGIDCAIAEIKRLYVLVKS